MVRILLILLLFSKAHAQFARATLMQPVFDREAKSYFDRLGGASYGANLAIRTRINTCIAIWKSAGVWAKIYDRGFLFWGSAAANSVTLKGTQSIAWVPNTGSITHAANGVSQSGGGYANTGILPTVVPLNDVHLSIYAGNDVVSGASIGSVSAGSTSSFRLFPEVGGNALGDMYTQSTSVGRISRANAVSSGFLGVNRSSAADLRLYRRGVQLGTAFTISNTVTFHPAFPLYLMASNNAGTAGNFDTHRLLFWSVGTSMSDAEWAADNNAIEAVLDHLGIGVQ